MTVCAAVPPPEGVELMKAVELPSTAFLFLSPDPGVGCDHPFGRTNASKGA